MAIVVNRSASAVIMGKAVVLVPLALVLLAMAAGASGTGDGPAVAKSGGRFLENAGGRKLLLTNHTIQACGNGTAPNYSCKLLLPAANNATCCTDSRGNQGCWDVGAAWLDKCGSCNTTCKVGDVCCSGVCTNLLTDTSNCGACGNKCIQALPRCLAGFCNY